MRGVAALGHALARSARSHPVFAQQSEQLQQILHRCFYLALPQIKRAQHPRALTTTRTSVSTPVIRARIGPSVLILIRAAFPPHRPAPGSSQWSGSCAVVRAWAGCPQLAGASVFSGPLSAGRVALGVFAHPADQHSVLRQLVQEGAVSEASVDHPVDGAFGNGAQAGHVLGGDLIDVGLFARFHVGRPGGRVGVARGFLGQRASCQSTDTRRAEPSSVGMAAENWNTRWPQTKLMLKGGQRGSLRQSQPGMRRPVLRVMKSSSATTRGQAESVVARAPRRTCAKISSTGRRWTRRYSADQSRCCQPTVLRAPVTVCRPRFSKPASHWVRARVKSSGEARASSN
ncbi:MAG: hypothetical protein RL693_952 [Verrucomicrobiota bacterium]